MSLPRLSVPAAFDAAVRLLGMAFAVGAIILASRWLTELTAPRPVAILPSLGLVEPDIGIKTVSRLFGGGEIRSDAIEGLRLTGVYTGSRGSGFATFQSRNEAISAFAGDEVVPGVKVKQIEGDRVILLTGSGPRELRLQALSLPGVPSRGQTAPPAGQPASAAQPAPPDGQVAASAGSAGQAAPSAEAPSSTGEATSPVGQAVPSPGRATRRLSRVRGSPDQ